MYLLVLNYTIFAFVNDICKTLNRAENSQSYSQNMIQLYFFPVSFLNVSQKLLLWKINLLKAISSFL